MDMGIEKSDPFDVRRVTGSSPVSSTKDRGIPHDVVSLFSYAGGSAGLYPSPRFSLPFGENYAIIQKNDRERNGHNDEKTPKGS